VVSEDPGTVKGAAAVYTDTWVSMHQEHEAERRERVFRPYAVTAELMATARRDAVFMHCLPAHRGEEVTAGVIDSPASVVFDQAENRLHAQNAVLLHLVKPPRGGEGAGER
jgi:ornithine carbamoyltransferase